MSIVLQRAKESEVRFVGAENYETPDIPGVKPVMETYFEINKNHYEN